MKESELLGLPLDQALEKLKREGMEMRVEKSTAPRTQREGGTLRVVRVRDGVLTVCAFMDGIPQ